MTFDLPLTTAAFAIGIVVGLTGMGGGALMTPVLVLVFDVLPLTAVSSDLVASAVMKPVGSLVHPRRGPRPRGARSMTLGAGAWSTGILVIATPAGSRSV